MKKSIVFILGLILFYSCQKDTKEITEIDAVEEVKPVIIEEFGYILNDYKEMYGRNPDK